MPKCENHFVGIEYEYDGDRKVRQKDVESWDLGYILTFSDRRNGTGYPFKYCPDCGTSLKSFWGIARAIAKENGRT